ncbi:MAG: DUF1015 family protein [Rhodospirillaceae bacterium]|jgi:uncharacterized protein (DUF1015 family)|nr:DUF1015 family protein [Rhodospirillaceae bacterium]
MSVPLLRPFLGLRPIVSKVAEVVAPPYDVLTSEEARILANGRPCSFLHISKPEIDVPIGTNVYSSSVYAKASENLRRMIDAGVLYQDPAQCFYIYRIEMEDHVQTGIVGACSIVALDTNRIRKHELTRQEKEDDRFHQIDACNAQTGAVLLAHNNSNDLMAVIAKITSLSPAYRVMATDNNIHSLWCVNVKSDISVIIKTFDEMSVLYIADGHHRSAAASRVALNRRTLGASADALSQSFLVVSFPIDEMKIFEYNRVVRDLNGLSYEDFLTKLETNFIVEVVSSDQAKPSSPHNIGLYLQKRWYRLIPKYMIPDDPLAHLDVSLLNEQLLAPVLNINDLRNDERIDFVGGKRGLSELEQRVDSGEMAIAFALFATQMDDLIAVTNTGKMMPPKSTWFEPKLVDGLVSYLLD